VSPPGRSRSSRRGLGASFGLLRGVRVTGRQSCRGRCLLRRLWVFRVARAHVTVRFAASHRVIWTSTVSAFAVCSAASAYLVQRSRLGVRRCRRHLRGLCGEAWSCHSKNNMTARSCPLTRVQSVSPDTCLRTVTRWGQRPRSMTPPLEFGALRRSR
jgi:hypothetical protein